MSGAGLDEGCGAASSALDAAAVQDVAYRAERSVGEFGQFSRASSGAVLLDDEGLNARLHGRIRTWACRTAELRERRQVRTWWIGHGSQPAVLSSSRYSNHVRPRASADYSGPTTVKVSQSGLSFGESRWRKCARSAAEARSRCEYGKAVRAWYVGT